VCHAPGSPVSVQYCGAACVPNCERRNCGDDGCGADCGVCLRGQACNENGQCVADEPQGCPEGSQLNVCGEIENEFGEMIPSSRNGTVTCNFQENVAICRQVNDAPDCYYWDIIQCNTCCEDGFCRVNARECR
jgi:hypothetical protein